MTMSLSAAAAASVRPTLPYSGSVKLALGTTSYEARRVGPVSTADPDLEHVEPDLIRLDEPGDFVIDDFDFS